MPRTISKSKYLSGLQCPKLLWTQIHDKDSIPLYDESTLAIFDQGHDVGHLAQTLFPDGISIPWEAPPGEKLTLTREALKACKPIYEATLSAGGAYCQVDILVPNGDQWDIVEVKSSTSVHDVNLHDLSLQRYACESAGLSIGKCILAHLNNQYVRQGDIDVHKLFKLEDCTEAVADLAPAVPQHLQEMQDVLAATTVPDIAIGPHCSDPYGCPLKETCWAFVPEHPIFELYYIGGKAWPLFEQGVHSILQIDSAIGISDKQAIQAKCVQTGQPHIDRAAIQRFLDGLTYPLWLLDFETFQSAVPRYDGTKPYQQIPFQFSLHRIEAPGEEPEHHSWLAEGRGDPRQGFLTALQAALGPDGDIVAYNIGFEKGRLNELALKFPEYADWVEQTNSRFVDLIQPFRDFAFYHPDQHGSCSLKYVLPALTGKTYEGMEIADGTAAARAFIRVELGDVPRNERLQVREDMEAYCEQDTMGMAWLLSDLQRVATS